MGKLTDEMYANGKTRRRGGQMYEPRSVAKACTSTSFLVPDVIISKRGEREQQSAITTTEKWSRV